jgi:hypothetical protein
MSNLAIHINLTRIPGAIFTKLTGKTGAIKECIIIPIENANLFVGEKGVYLDATALEYREQKYADSHFIKMSVPKEIFETMSDEEKNAIPIIGGIKPIVKPQMQPGEPVDYAPGVGEGTDLPF